ncbi:hypothetical protein Tco_0579003 [Tanacetum coccineum]
MQGVGVIRVRMDMGDKEVTKQDLVLKGGDRGACKLLGDMRAWLLKLLALELHVGIVTLSNHREVCHNIVAHLFAQGGTEYDNEHYILFQSSPEDAAYKGQI